MKLLYSTFLAGIASSALLAAESTNKFTNINDQISYALGVNFGMNLKNQSIDANLDLIQKGIADALAGKPLLNDSEMRDTFTQLRAQINTKRQEKAAANKIESEKWLAENAKKPDVRTTETGLQYKIITEGSGPSPSLTDEVSVKYTGKLIDGTVFDSTDRNDGKPRRFRVNGVIPGWSQALQKMKKGAKWELYISPQLGYGERGTGNIPPNSVLIFEVELVDIHPVTPPPAPPQQQVTSDIIKVPSAEELKKGAKIEIIKPEDVEKEIAKEKARKEAEEKAKKPQ